MSENKPLREQKTLLMRQNLVLSAVRFLNSLSVKGSPVQSQIDFLRRKGLSPNEIKSALERAEVNISNKHSDRTIWLAISYWLFPENLGYGSLGLLLKLTRLTLTLALLVYFCCKAVEVIFRLFPQLRPLASRLLLRIRTFLGFRPEEVPEIENQPTERLILDSFKEMQEQNENYVEDSMMNQMQNIEDLKQEMEEMKANQESNLKELRSEIKSVRSLLLSTSQFPQPQSPPPPHTQASQPFTPSGMFHRRSTTPAATQLTSLDSIFSGVNSGANGTAQNDQKGLTEEVLNPVTEVQSQTAENTEDRT